jgi:hypothetical protein
VCTLAREAVANGAQVRRVPNGHIELGKGSAAMQMPSTPSEHRNRHNVRRDMRAAGILS